MVIYVQTLNHSKTWSHCFCQNQEWEKQSTFFSAHKSKFFNIRFRLVYWFKSKCLYGAPLLGLAQNNSPLGQTQHYVASKNTIENRSHIILHVSPINIKLIKVRQKMEDETCLKITLCMNKHLHSNGKLRVQDSALEHETWNNLLWHPNIY